MSEPRTPILLLFSAMTENPLKELLPHGAIGFPVTPFHGDFSLDLEGFMRNLEIVLAEPFTAFVAAGGTGELYSLAGRISFRHSLGGRHGERANARDCGGGLWFPHRSNHGGRSRKTGCVSL